MQDITLLSSKDELISKSRGDILQVDTIPNTYIPNKWCHEGYKYRDSKHGAWIAQGPGCKNTDTIGNLELH
eukprot:10327846-Ditylum_brightwellii.AAC.2